MKRRYSKTHCQVVESDGNFDWTWFHRYTNRPFEPEVFWRVWVEIGASL